MSSLQGDYEQRVRGLANLMRPYDVFKYDRWRHEAMAGVVGVVPQELRVGYALLVGAALYHKRSLGAAPDYSGAVPWHPLMFLYSCLSRGGRMTRFSPLISTAYEELIHG